LSANAEKGTLVLPVMTRTFLALTVLAVAAGVAPVASAGLVTSSTRVVGGVSAQATEVPASQRFDLVGLRWRGAGRVELRTRSVGGAWTPWRDAAPEPMDRPDAGAGEGRRLEGWTVGNPWWVGPSERLQVRARGAVRSVRVTFVRSPEVRIPLRTLAETGAPAIVARSAWSADESIRRGEPTYAPDLRYAIVHHTAGSNDYSRSEAAAIVRGIQAYHVRSNGWNDIGYNFLVDRFGTIYEGRYGGIDQNVVGAHALGFNTGSVGVALLGTYTSPRPSAAAEKAIATLLSWRLDLAYIDPLATITVPSGGSDRYPAGVAVQLRTVSGHRDTGFTACPGDALYARLGALAAQAAATGGPKLYYPLADGALGGPIRFTARLSQPLRWQVVVAGADGAEVARGTGSSTAIDWTWDSSAAAQGAYRWTIGAGSGDRSVRPASGTLGSVVEPAPLELLGVSADPPTISPNGDGDADATVVAYTLSADATVAATVLDEAGWEVAELEPARWRRAGEHTVGFDGGDLPDGRYAVRLVARSADGVEVEARVPVSITRTLALASLVPAVFSPNGDGRGDRARVSLTLGREAAVRVRVLRGERWVATPFDGRLKAGRRTILWDGSKRVGRLRDGDYTLVLEVTDEVATTRIAFPLTSDTTAPRLRLVSRTPPRIAVSEPATVRLRVNGAVRRLRITEAGTVTIPGVRGVRTLIASARDAVGNRSRVLTAR
jgi:hypothetical protein